MFYHSLYFFDGGEFDDVHQGGLVVLFGDGAFIHPHGKGGVLVHGPQGQAHSQAQPFSHNGSLQEDGFPVEGLVPGTMM